MTTHRILIVDDQHEVRRMLRAGLETLGPDIQVVDVPSGEEAMLVISRQQIDILVIDVRLPGISGLELRQRAQLLNPNLKLILVTGVVDPNVRRQVSESGVDAYFFKPIEMSDFLSTVERFLGLTQQKYGSGAVNGQPAEGSSFNLSARISTLYRELEAICVLLFDARGRVVAQAGALPDSLNEPNMLAALLATSSASNRVSSFLRRDTPQNLLYFSGVNYDLYVSPVGSSMAILLIGVAGAETDPIGKILPALRSAIEDIHSIQTNQDSPPSLQAESSERISELQEGIEQEGTSPELDLIFSSASDEQLEPDEVNAFWDTVNEQNESQATTGDNYLSFEQARRLGLAPGDEIE